MADDKDLVVLERQDGGVSSKLTVHCHGATVISWNNKGQEILFCSKQAVFDNKKAIRGGIPLVFPQFGPWSLGPQHGFARIKRWSIENPAKTLPNGDVKASLSLVDDEETRKMWNARFKLVYEVCLGEDCLSLSLNVHNAGSSSFDFTTLMHTYFHVPDISAATISGLKGLTFVDKVDPGEYKEDRDKITIDKNYDRIYQNCTGKVIVSPVGSGTSCAEIETSNFKDIVVWNPWADKAKGMSDFGDEEYKTMVCVEAGSVMNPVTLGAGDKTSFSQKITVKSKI